MYGTTASSDLHSAVHFDKKFKTHWVHSATSFYILIYIHTHTQCNVIHNHVHDRSHDCGNNLPIKTFKSVHVVPGSFKKVPSHILIYDSLIHTNIFAFEVKL